MVIGKKYYYKIVPKGSSFTFKENYFFYSEDKERIFHGNITLKNQKQINNFGRNLRYTEIVDGWLEIKQDYQTNITDLANLSTLKNVESLYLNYIYGLKSLWGLHNITMVSKGVSISNLPNLVKIELNNLSYIGGNLTIQDNAYLETISLKKLDSLFGDLIIGGSLTVLLYNKYGFYVNRSGVGNPLLENIFLDKLNPNFFRGGVYIYKNESLKNLDFLKNLEGTYKSLVIWDNDALTDIRGLSNFSAVAESFVLAENDNLISTKGLENIRIVGFGILLSGNKNLKDVRLLSLDTVGQFHIVNNNKLENLSDLIALRKTGIGFSVYDNNNLSDFCGLNNLCKYGDYNNKFNVKGNSYNPSKANIINGYCK